MEGVFKPARLALLLLASLFPPGPLGQTSCPERFARYPDPVQCDAYSECINGVLKEQLCPDGLLFSPEARGYPCLHPPEVDCQGRTSIQPAQPTEQCPHQFGFFRFGDSINCGQFMICSNGIGHIFDCPEGLAFNEISLRCDWPDLVESCNAEAFLGFSCPLENTVFGPWGYKFFRSTQTCEKYYLCIDGRPRLLSCGKGKAFNDDTLACDDPVNVTGCAIPSTSQLNYQNSNYQQQPNNFQQQPSYFSG